MPAVGGPARVLVRLVVSRERMGLTARGGHAPQPPLGRVAEGVAVGRPGGIAVVEEAVPVARDAACLADVREGRGPDPFEPVRAGSGECQAVAAGGNGGVCGVGHDEHGCAAEARDRPDGERPSLVRDEGEGRPVGEPRGQEVLRRPARQAERGAPSHVGDPDVGIAALRPGVRDLGSARRKGRLRRGPGEVRHPSGVSRGKAPGPRAAEDEPQEGRRAEGRGRRCHREVELACGHSEGKQAQVGRPIPPAAGLEREARLSGRLEPIGGSLLETPPDHGVERGRDGPRVGGRVLLQDGRHDVGRRLAGEGAPAAEHLVEHAPVREDVRACVRRGAPDLLGAHVAGRAQDPALLRRVVGGGGLGVDGGPGGPFGSEPGQAEVENLHPSVPRDEQVVRLEIAVDDALLVGRGQAEGDLDAQLRGPRGRHGSPFQALAEALPLEELGDHVGRTFVGTEIVEYEDVGVIESCYRTSLLLESPKPVRVRGELRGQDLHRHLSA